MKNAQWEIAHLDFVLCEDSLILRAAMPGEQFFVSEITFRLSSTSVELNSLGLNRIRCFERLPSCPCFSPLLFLYN